MSWHNDSQEHALASRGVRTKEHKLVSSGSKEGLKIDIKKGIELQKDMLNAVQTALNDLQTLDNYIDGPYQNTSEDPKTNSYKQAQIKLQNLRQRAKISCDTAKQKSLEMEHMSHQFQYFSTRIDNIRKSNPWSLMFNIREYYGNSLPLLKRNR
jgi:hypothetical protein